ncbi:sensor histidine kinase KdpD [Halobacteriovorax sp. HLS]|uniref:sensor histidine kinase n=1 Tax=Halobacteriovorax sp. HLS TaxID=2234000 RepID=UPI000FDB7B0E|nr:HAMP domain-containing sensor histidine kinase [Halobacteriovorax sp. HLS]
MKSILESIHLTLRNVALTLFTMMILVHGISIVKEVKFINESAYKTAGSLSNFLEETIEINDIIGLNILLNSIKNNNIATLIFSPAAEYNIFPAKIQIGENIYESNFLYDRSFNINNNGHNIGNFSIHLNLLSISKNLFLTNLPLYIALAIFLFLTFVIANYKISSTLIKINRDAFIMSREGLSINEIKEHYSKLEDKVKNNTLSKIYISVMKNILDGVKKSNEADKLKALAKEKLNIARQVSHDIRGPISAIKMSLTNEQPNSILSSSLMRIENIANDLLDQSRPKSEIVLIEPIAAIKQIIAEKMAAQKINITLEDNGVNGQISVSPIMFKRVLSNLLNNAIEATQQLTAKISVSLTLNDGILNITISDNGTGIDKEILEKINEGISISAGKQAGNGIGLASAYESIVNWNGSLKVESTLNKGTRVIIELPFINNSHSKNIIHLDDDELIRMSWSITAQKLSQNFLSFEKVQDIDLEKLNKDDFFYIDHELNDESINGEDFCQRLLQEGFSNIFLSTGHSRDHFPNLDQRIVLTDKTCPF